MAFIRIWKWLTDWKNTLLLVGIAVALIAIAYGVYELLFGVSAAAPKLVDLAKTLRDYRGQVNKIDTETKASLRKERREMRRTRRRLEKDAVQKKPDELRKDLMEGLDLDTDL